jgi:hypothetical protein
MSDELVCPRCDSDDHLTGERDGEIIHITCSECAVSWDRDLQPKCPTCGNEDVRATPKAIVQKARGTQLSIMSFETVHLCPKCDADLWEEQKQTNSPIAPTENPADGIK